MKSDISPIYLLLSRISISFVLLHTNFILTLTRENTVHYRIARISQEYDDHTAIYALTCLLHLWHNRSLFCIATGEHENHILRKIWRHNTKSHVLHSRSRWRHTLKSRTTTFPFKSRYANNTRWPLINNSTIYAAWAPNSITVYLLS